MKRLVVCFLMLSLILCYFLAGQAENNNEAEVFITKVSGDDYEYILLKDGTAEITRYKGTTVKVVIPSSLDGIPVTSLGCDAFLYCHKLTSVTIPDGITELVANPFYTCSKISEVIVSPGHPVFETIDGVLFNKTDKSVVCYPRDKKNTSYIIPQGIETIGEGAFYWCSHLKSVIIPDSVTSIGNLAFYNCGNLTSITIPNSITALDANILTNCNKLSEVIVSPDHPSLSTVDGVLFSKEDKRLVFYPIAKNDIEYVIPQDTKIIGNDAFFGCSNLITVIIPDSVTCIGNYAFLGCSSLKTITIPDGVTTIGFNPFQSCNNLSEVIVSPDHPALVTIDGVLFSKADERLIWYPLTKKDAEYVIPMGTKIIGVGAFTTCTNLSSITIPESVTSIEPNAFYHCVNLASIIIPDTVTCIEQNAFGICNSITTITIPDSVTSIKLRAFFRCSNLTTITIGNCVTFIGDEAFYNCPNLTSITIPESVTSIGVAVFAECPNLIVTVTRDSFAQRYCEEQGVRYTYADN